MRRHNLLNGLFIIFLGSGLLAQAEDDLRVFGYFQTGFQHVSSDVSKDENTFNLQQLNLFFQKNISTHWSAFVNFEILNNYSSSRHWGRSTWKRPGSNTVITNHLPSNWGCRCRRLTTSMRSKTAPAAAVNIRPLIYETSFGEFLALEEFVPARAFAQVYGFWPIGG